MKSSTLWILLIFVIQTAIILTGFYMSGLIMVGWHESVHKEIFKEYNISSNITINHWNLSGKTVPEENTTCPDDCLLAHNQNEIIGYTANGIMQGLWIIWLVTDTSIWLMLLLYEVLSQ